VAIFVSILFEGVTPSSGDKFTVEYFCAIRIESDDVLVDTGVMNATPGGFAGTASSLTTADQLRRARTGAAYPTRTLFRSGRWLPPQSEQHAGPERSTEANAPAD